MNEIVPVQVYNNLIKMMNYRGANVTSPDLSEGQMIEKLNHYNYVTITGSREGTLITIILIAPTNEKNDYATRSGNFKKLFKLVPKFGPDENLELIFISELPLTSHIQKHLIQFKVENPKVLIEDHTYDIFMIENPKHEIVPSHRIATQEEVDAFCLYFYISPENFPKISCKDDPQAIWLGARPSMVIAIDRASENAGFFPIYRFCVKN